MKFASFLLLAALAWGQQDVHCYKGNVGIGKEVPCSQIEWPKPEPVVVRAVDENAIEREAAMTAKIPKGISVVDSSTGCKIPPNEKPEDYISHMECIDGVAYDVLPKWKCPPKYLLLHSEDNQSH